MRALEFLREYTDPEEAKRDIISRVNAIDPNDEDQTALLDKVYTMLHANKVADRFTPDVEAALEGEYKETAIKEIAEKMVASTRLNLNQKNTFLENFKQDKCLNPKVFLRSGHYNIAKDLFYGSNENYQMFLEFLDWGAGKSRAGKGEHALAILSKSITQKGLGDIDVSGKPVELKVATTKGSGRLGEGGVNPEVAKTIIAKFPELTEALNNFALGGHDTGTEFIKSKGKVDKPQKSINVSDFTRIVNSLGLDPAKKQAIGDAIFGNAFGKHGDIITAAFAKSSASPKEVTAAYISANFDWYKDNPDMGGAWEYLTSMGLGTGGMVTATSGGDLSKLYSMGALAENKPMIIPTQQTDVFFQVNPMAK